MPRFGAIIRFLMLAACLVPVTSAQQAAGALAPVLSVPLPVPDAPVVPVSEEDDERETAAGKERSAAGARHRAPARERRGAVPLAFATHGEPGRHPTFARTTPPSPADPFRNGLGTHYRC